MFQNTGTLSIFMNNTDLNSYQVVLQAASNIMTALLNNGMCDTLILICMAFFFGEIILSYGDLKRVKFGNYAAIIGMYVFIFSKTVDVQIIKYNPVDMTPWQGPSTVLVKNMPYAPALMLKIIFDLDYNMKIVIDKVFYEAHNVNVNGSRGKFFDKVTEYSDLISGNIHDANLSLLYTSFLKNIVIPDIHSDQGNNDITVMANNDMSKILEQMYDGSFNNAVSGINDHSFEELIYIQDNNPKKGTIFYVINTNQYDSLEKSDPCIVINTNSIITKGQFYISLRENLKNYYDSLISNLSTSYPEFLLSVDYNNTIAQAKIYSNINMNYISSLKDMLTATIFNIDSGKIQGLYGARNMFDLTESSIESSTGALVKASTLKLIVECIINVIILLFIFAFPAIFIAAFFPNMLGVVKSFFVSFFVLSFAGPLSYFLECVSDVYTTGVFAMNLAGSAAGLSQRAQAGILNTYDAMPWVTTIVYGGAMAALFGLGSRTLNVIGEQLFQESTGPVAGNTGSLITDNMSFGNRSFGALSAFTASGFSCNTGDWSINGYAMNRANDFITGLNRNENSILKYEKDELLKNGFHYDNKSKWSIGNSGNDQVTAANFLRRIDNEPVFKQMIIEGASLNRSLLKGQDEIHEKAAYMNVNSHEGEGSFAKSQVMTGMTKLHGWQQVMEQYGAQRYQSAQEYNRSLSASIGFEVPFMRLGEARTSASKGDQLSYMQNYNKLTAEVFNIVKDINWDKNKIDLNNNREIMNVIDRAVNDSGISIQAKETWNSFTMNAYQSSADPFKQGLEAIGITPKEFTTGRSDLAIDKIADYLRANNFNLR